MTIIGEHTYTKTGNNHLTASPGLQPFAPS